MWINAPKEPEPQYTQLCKGHHSTEGGYDTQIDTHGHPLVTLFSHLNIGSKQRAPTY